MNIVKFAKYSKIQDIQDFPVLEHRPELGELDGSEEQNWSNLNFSRICVLIEPKKVINLLRLVIVKYNLHFMVLKKQSGM